MCDGVCVCVCVCCVMYGVCVLVFLQGALHVMLLPPVLSVCWCVGVMCDGVMVCWCDV